MLAMKAFVLASLAMMVAVFVLALAPSPAHADQSGIISNKACEKLKASGDIAGCNGNGASVDDNSKQDSLAKRIVNLFLYAAGIVSFIFLIIGGIRYITATGDPARIQSAKDTVLYAIIGLIITFLAVPISAYVIKAAEGN